jgi:hypothetical protein
MNSRLLVPLLLCPLLTPMPLAAQTTPAPTPGGPMTVERVHSGLLAAPDLKVTEVDKRTSELVGGYAGWIYDSTLFVGGGGYWLTNTNRDTEMGYGGLVLQLLSRTNNAFGFSVNGLVGGGRATLTSTVPELVRGIDGRIPDLRFDQRFDPRFNQRTNTILTNVRVRTRQDFFVAEPQVDLLVRITPRMRLTAGAGYRFIAADRGGDNRLRGAVGAVGVQFGGHGNGSGIW